MEGLVDTASRRGSSPSAAVEDLVNTASRGGGSPNAAVEGLVDTTSRRGGSPSTPLKITITLLGLSFLVGCSSPTPLTEEDRWRLGWRMTDLMEEYGIDSSEVASAGAFSVDGSNREFLRAIIESHGFPTREMVGATAMNGVFIIIQHSDQDPEWQKAQLPLVERAVKAGDLR